MVRMIDCTAAAGRTLIEPDPPTSRFSPLLLLCLPDVPFPSLFLTDLSLPPLFLAFFFSPMPSLTVDVHTLSLRLHVSGPAAAGLNMTTPPRPATACPSNCSTRESAGELPKVGVVAELLPVSRLSTLASCGESHKRPLSCWGLT